MNKEVINASLIEVLFSFYDGLFISYSLFLI